jgi:hypothetical protein
MTKAHDMLGVSKYWKGVTLIRATGCFIYARHYREVHLTYKGSSVTYIQEVQIHDNLYTV